MTQPPEDADPPRPQETSAPDPAPPPSARDLVRGRKRPGRLPDTGRRHHIGAAPEAVPLHTATGVEVTRVTAWQLADRTPAQLAAQRTTTVEQMRKAAEELDFETAARLRDELTAVEAELSRRAAPAGPGSHPEAQDPARPHPAGPPSVREQPKESQQQGNPGDQPPPGDGPPTSAGSAE